MATDKSRLSAGLVIAVWTVGLSIVIGLIVAYVPFLECGSCNHLRTLHPNLTGKIDCMHCDGKERLTLLRHVKNRLDQWRKGDRAFP